MNRGQTPVKCQYRGRWSNVGCNEDAVSGTRFCHAHRNQGPANEFREKVSGCWGCIFVVLVMLVAILSLIGTCESQ